MSDVLAVMTLALVAATGLVSLATVVILVRTNHHIRRIDAAIGRGRST